MRKLDIGATIREAYSFTFTHLGAIIGLIWLPMVIVTVAGFFVEQRYYAAAQAALAANDYASMGPAVLGIVFYLFGALLLYAMMYVPVTQLALGIRQGGAMARFSFGAPEWRMFRAILGLVLFLMMPVVLLGLVASFALKPGLPQGPSLAAMQAGFVLIYCGLVFFALRFAFLLPAVVVSEDKTPLARSWTLSGGNFWRILAVLLASVGPVILLAMAAQMLLNGTASMPELDSTPTGMALQMHAMRSNLPIAAGINFLVAPLTLGLAVGAGAAAYRALTASGAAPSTN